MTVRGVVYDIAGTVAILAFIVAVTIALCWAEATFWVGEPVCSRLF